MRISRLAPTLTALLLVVVLGACSDDGDGAPDQARLEPALLTVDNLGDAFEVAPDDEDDEDDGPDLGCLLDFDLPGVDAVEEDDEVDGPEAEFQASAEPNMPLVMHGITDTGDGAEAAGVIDQLWGHLAAFTEVDVTDDEGMRWQLDVDHDTDTWAPGSDQQLTIVASGTATRAPLELPLSFAMSFVRTGDVVTIIMFFDIADDVTEAQRDVVTVACERLDAVLHDEPLPEPEAVLDDYPVGEAYEELLSGTSAGPLDA